ncbi:hypothetical protein GX408_10730, partial [bacterium]|nr:hypothetical protein [bacterium]
GAAAIGLLLPALRLLLPADQAGHNRQIACILDQDAIGLQRIAGADIATPQQVDRLVAQLPRFEYDHGLVQTVEKYPSPHSEFVHLQWDYPSGWPTFQILICEALISKGYSEIARRIAQKYLRLQLDLYQSTGKLWEKYNVIEGNLNLPVERYPAVPLHGWSCTSIAYLGRLLF